LLLPTNLWLETSPKFALTIVTAVHGGPVLCKSFHLHAAENLY
jgi:hypothetical protein